MGNHKSKININDIELVYVSNINRIDADFVSIDDNHNFCDIDGKLCFKLFDDIDFFCDFTYQHQINNTVLIMDGKPIEYDDSRLENFLILFCNKINDNLYELIIKINDNDKLDKLYLNVKNIY